MKDDTADLRASIAVLEIYVGKVFSGRVSGWWDGWRGQYSTADIRACTAAIRILRDAQAKRSVIERLFR